MASKFKLSFLVDNKQLAKQLAKSQKQLGVFSKQGSKSGAAWGKAMRLGGVAAAAGLTAATKALTSYTKKGDGIDKASKRIGIAAEEYQKLGFAAEQSGSSSVVLEKAFKTLSGAVVDAEAGLKTYKDAFDRIGVSTSDLAAMKPDEQFKRLADAISGIEDPTVKAATAADIFGRAGTELLPLLNEGSAGIAELGRQAEATGNIMSGEAAANAARLNDAMNTLKHTLGGVLNDALGPVIPVLADLGEKLGPLLGDAFGTLAPALANLAEGLFPALQSVMTLLVSVLEALTPLLDTIAQLLEHAIAPAIEGVALALQAILVPILEGVGELFRNIVNGIIFGINAIISGINLLPGIPDIPLIPALEEVGAKSDEAANAFEQAGKDIQQSANKEWRTAAEVITEDIEMLGRSMEGVSAKIEVYTTHLGDHLVTVPRVVAEALQEMNYYQRIEIEKLISELDRLGMNFLTMSKDDIPAALDLLNRKSAARLGDVEGHLELLIGAVDSYSEQWATDFGDVQTAYEQLVATSEHAVQQIGEDAGSLDEISFVNWRQEILDTEQAMRDMQLTVAGFEESHGNAGFENWYVKMRDLRDFAADALESQRGITQEIAERNVITDPLAGLDNESLAGLTGVEAVGQLQRVLREFELAALADDKLTLGEVQQIGRIESQLSSVARAFGIDLEAIEQYNADMNQSLEDLNRKGVELPGVIEGAADEALLQAQDAAQQQLEQAEKLQSITRLGAEGIIEALESGLITQAELLGARIAGLIQEHTWQAYLALSGNTPAPGSVPAPTMPGVDLEGLSAALRGVATDAAAVPDVTFTKQGSGIVATLPNGTVFIPGGHDPIQYLRDNFNVPGLARGGIVTRPTLALIGEQGPEAVVPLNQSGAGGITVNFYGDVYGDELSLGRAVTDALAEQERLTGSALAI